MVFIWLRALPELMKIVTLTQMAYSLCCCAACCLGGCITPTNSNQTPRISIILALRGEEVSVVTSQSLATAKNPKVYAKRSWYSMVLTYILNSSLNTSVSSTSRDAVLESQ